MPLTAEEAESGLDLKHHIDANIEAFSKLPQTESIATSVSILQKLGMLNDARFHFFEAQKKMMEELAGELKKLAEHIATLANVEAAITGQPTHHTTNDTENHNASTPALIQHIQAIEKHLRELPQTEEITALVTALEQIVELEHGRHAFSGTFKQVLENISQVLGKLPEHMAKLESVKEAIGGASQSANNDNEGGEIADRDQEQ